MWAEASSSLCFVKPSNSYMLTESLVLNVYCGLRENQWEQRGKYAKFCTLHIPCHMISKTVCKEDISTLQVKNWGWRYRAVSRFQTLTVCYVKSVFSKPTCLLAKPFWISEHLKHWEHGDCFETWSWKVDSTLKDVVGKTTTHNFWH